MLETQATSVNTESYFKTPYDRLVELVRGKYDEHKDDIEEALEYIKNPKAKLQNDIDSLFFKQFTSKEAEGLRTELGRFGILNRGVILMEIWSMHNMTWGHEKEKPKNKKIFLTEIAPAILRDVSKFKGQEANERLSKYSRLLNAIRFDIPKFAELFQKGFFEDKDNDAIDIFAKMWDKMFRSIDRYSFGNVHIRYFFKIIELAGQGINKEVIFEFGQQIDRVQRLLGPKMFDIEYVKFFIQNVTGKSIENIKKLRFIEKLDKTEQEILKFTLENSPKDFMRVLNLLNISNSLGIKIPVNIFNFLTKLDKANPETLRKFYRILSREEGKGKVSKRKIVKERSLAHINAKLQFETRPSEIQKLLKTKQKIEAEESSELDKPEKSHIPDLIHRVEVAKDHKTKADLSRELKMHLTRLTVPFYLRQIMSLVKGRVSKEFNVDLEEIKDIDWDSFSITYRMLLRLEDRKVSSWRYSAEKDPENVRKVLTHHLSKDKGSHWLIFPQNQKWLDKNIERDMQPEFLSPNEKTYEMPENMGGNLEVRLKFHKSEAIRFFKEMRMKVDESLSIEALIFKFKDINLKKLPKKFLPTYKDLAVQIEALEQLKALVGSRGLKMPKQIKIYRETDPVMITQMGTLVNGSCLNADGVNFWSTFSNALDVNKCVCYMKDENGNLLGRVLFAIDKNKKIVRFPIYYTDNCNFDINPFVNNYIKEFAQKFNLDTEEINGQVYEVSNLVFSDWYKDPPVKI